MGMALEHKEEQGFGLPVDSKPTNDPQAARVLSYDIQVTTPTSLGILHLMKSMVHIMIDPDALPYLHVILSILGEFKIPEVNLLLLNIPALYLP